VAIPTRLQLKGASILLLAVLMASCDSPHTGPSSSPTTSTTTEPATTTTTQSLQSIAWASVTVPPEVCPGLTQPVKLTPMSGPGGTYGSATVPAPAGHSFGTPDDLIDEAAVFYGSLESSQDVAALSVWCSNTGGTADGQIQSSLVVYSWVSGQLSVLSTLTPQQPSYGGSHVPYFDESSGGVTITPGSISARELFYGEQDETCCPSGRATTVWTFSGNTFSPRTTIQTEPAGS
jgi:hypothetical protein